MKLLIIDEDAPLANILKIHLTRDNYQVDLAEDFSQAICALNARDYDCILLDTSIEGGSGVGILHILHSPYSKSVVIVISSQDPSGYRFDANGILVHGYIRKPFDPAAIPSRVRSVMRHYKQGATPGPSFGNVELQTDRYGAWVGKSEVALKRKEYLILEYMMRQSLGVVSKASLVSGVWDGKPPHESKYDFLYMQMKNLRDKLEKAGADIGIVSIYGEGYKLVKTGPGR